MRQFIFLLHQSQNPFVLWLNVEIHGPSVDPLAEEEHTFGLADNRKHILEIFPIAFHQNKLFIFAYFVQDTVFELLQFELNEAGAVVVEKLAEDEVDRAHLLVPFELGDEAQPEVLVILDYFIGGVDVAQFDQFLPDDGYFEGVLREEVEVVVEDGQQAVLVGLEQFYEEGGVIFEDGQPELPQNIMQLQRRVDILIFPHDIVMEFLRKQGQVNGVPYKLHQTHLVDAVVLLEIHHSFVGVQFELSFLEVAFEVLLDQL